MEGLRDMEADPDRRREPMFAAMIGKRAANRDRAAERVVRRFERNEEPVAGVVNLLSAM